MFYLGGVGLAFFLTLLLISKGRKTLADKILTGWLLTISVHLLLFYIGTSSRFPQLLGIDIPFPLMHGPLLYAYTRALTNRALSQKAALLHAAPVIAVVIYLIPFLALPVEDKLYVYQHNGAGYEAFTAIKSAAVTVSGVLYVVLASVVLRNHRISIANRFSYREKISLDWLQYLIYGMSVIWILVIAGNDYLIFGAAVLFVLFIGFFGIRQAGIFQSASEPSEENTEVAAQIYAEGDGTTSGQEKRKYQKSGLSDEASENLHRQLTLLMTGEKLYRQSELSLADLAARLNTPPNYLSQVINEREQKNFYDYINTLRIEEFRRAAAGPDSRKYTLLALAQECGFNSKSSFNRYFKKVTGQSPSEFMQAASHPEK